jgi:hypothetical protein
MIDYLNHLNSHFLSLALLQGTINVGIFMSTNEFYTIWL